MIHYVERDTPRMLTMRRSGATEHALGDGTLRNDVSLAVARHICGAAGSAKKRSNAFVALQFL
jgi:hypothetical protein